MKTYGPIKRDNVPWINVYASDKESLRIAQDQLRSDYPNRHSHEYRCSCSNGPKMGIRCYREGKAGRRQDYYGFARLEGKPHSSDCIFFDWNPGVHGDDPDFRPLILFGGDLVPKDITDPTACDSWHRFAHIGRLLVGMTYNEYSLELLHNKANSACPDLRKLLILIQDRANHLSVRGLGKLGNAIENAGLHWVCGLTNRPQMRTVHDVGHRTYLPAKFWFSPEAGILKEYECEYDLLEHAARAISFHHRVISPPFLCLGLATNLGRIIHLVLVPGLLTPCGHFAPVDSALERKYGLNLFLQEIPFWRPTTFRDLAKLLHSLKSDLFSELPNRLPLHHFDFLSSLFGPCIHIDEVMGFRDMEYLERKYRERMLWLPYNHRYQTRLAYEDGKEWDLR